MRKKRLDTGGVGALKLIDVFRIPYSVFRIPYSVFRILLLKS